MRFKNILNIENEKFVLNVTEDKNKSNFALVVEVYYKSQDKPGILYSVNCYDRVESPSAEVDKWVNNTILHGQLSPRPYKPGQACDGTISSCTIALFLELCRHRCLDPLKIYLAAYGDQKPVMKRKELLASKSFADWQGVEYPKEWTSEAIIKTIDSLHNANYHALADQLEEELSL